MGFNSGIHDARALAVALTSGDPDRETSAYAQRRRDVAMRVVQPATTANRQGADTFSLENAGNVWNGSLRSRNHRTRRGVISSARA